MAIAIKEKRQIEKAVAKAKTVKPRVKVLGYCKFEVSGSKGDSYQVSFSKGSEGGIEGDCSCTAGKKSKSVCYHIAACAGIAKQQVMERASARLTCQEGECQLVAVDGSTYCEFHTELSEMSRIYSCESIEVECRKCGDFYPEAEMSGPGYNPICPSCLLFG